MSFNYPFAFCATGLNQLSTHPRPALASSPLPSLFLRFYVRALPATEVSAEYNAMEEEESLALHQEIDEGDDDEFEPESEPESDIEPLLDPEPDNSTIETAFAAMQLKPQVEVAEDEATRRRNRWEDESDNAASSESEPETEEEFDDGLTDANPGMGAGNKDLHYDPDVMFNQIVAYFDLSELAQKNGLEMPRGNVAEADKQWVISNGND